MDAELKHGLAQMYKFIRHQQEAILEMSVAIEAFQRTATSNPSFATRYQEELAAARDSDRPHAHALMLRLIDAQIRQMEGPGQGDPSPPQA